MLHIMKYLSEALSVSPQNCTAESRAVHKYKAAQAPTGNFLASLCHINETRKHYSAVFISHFFLEMQDMVIVLLTWHAKWNIS